MNEESLPKNADLHIHTHFSDGTFSPQEVIERAKDLRLSAISITDHDTVDALPLSFEHARGDDLEVIPGIELTAKFAKSEVHILGYLIDWQSEWFLSKLSEVKKMRMQRLYEMIKKLSAFGIDIELEELLRFANSSSPGRLHLARFMQKKGYVSSIEEAFTRYIGNFAPCYIERFRLSAKEAIGMIQRAGGIPVLAHPHNLNHDELIRQLVGYGLKGLEAYYPLNTPLVNKNYLNLAKKYNLLITGGSDCHGLAKEEVLMGKVRIPYQLVEELKQAKRLNE